MVLHQPFLDSDRSRGQPAKALLPCSGCLFRVCKEGSEVVSGPQGLEVAVIGQEKAGARGRKIFERLGFSEPVYGSSAKLLSEFFAPSGGQGASLRTIAARWALHCAAR